MSNSFSPLRLLRGARHDVHGASLAAISHLLAAYANIPRMSIVFPFCTYRRGPVAQYSDRSIAA